jgi:hypothetical protein
VAPPPSIADCAAAFDVDLAACGPAELVALALCWRGAEADAARRSRRAVYREAALSPDCPSALAALVRIDRTEALVEAVVGSSRLDGAIAQDARSALLDAATGFEAMEFLGEMAAGELVDPWLAALAASQRARRPA